jgi:hypothetical protein
MHGIPIPLAYRVKLNAPLCRPLKEYSENIKHLVIGLPMHAQSMDEVQNIQISSIRNSSIKCPIDKCHTILES